MNSLGIRFLLLSLRSFWPLSAILLSLSSQVHQSPNLTFQQPTTNELSGRQISSSQLEILCPLTAILPHCLRKFSKPPSNISACLKASHLTLSLKKTTTHGRASQTQKNLICAACFAQIQSTTLILLEGST